MSSRRAFLVALAAAAVAATRRRRRPRRPPASRRRRLPGRWLRPRARTRRSRRPRSRSGTLVGDVTVPCPAGKRVVGGGFGSDRPREVSTSWSCSRAARADATGTPELTETGDVARAWLVWVWNIAETTPSPGSSRSAPRAPTPRSSKLRSRTPTAPSARGPPPARPARVRSAAAWASSTSRADPVRRRAQRPGRRHRPAGVDRVQRVARSWLASIARISTGVRPLLRRLGRDRSRRRRSRSRKPAGAPTAHLPNALPASARSVAASVTQRRAGLAGPEWAPRRDRPDGEHPVRRRGESVVRLRRELRARGIADSGYFACPRSSRAARPILAGGHRTLCRQDGDDGRHGSPDSLRGTPGPDVIAGLSGNDAISGLGGNDIVCGGGGNDTIAGGAGQRQALRRAR